MEREGFTEIPPIGTYSACKGAFCTMETSFNAVSLSGQKFWVFEDPVMETNMTAQNFQDFSEHCSDLMDNKALQIHSCSVIHETGYFSHMLVTKFEMHLLNTIPKRTLETFLLYLTLQYTGIKIYVWIDRHDQRENTLSDLLINYYHFQESKRILFCPSKDRQISKPNENIIQLEADVATLKKEVFV